MRALAFVLLGTFSAVFAATFPNPVQMVCNDNALAFRAQIAGATYCFQRAQRGDQDCKILAVTVASQCAEEDMTSACQQPGMKDRVGWFAAYGKGTINIGGPTGERFTGEYNALGSIDCHANVDVIPWPCGVDGVSAFGCAKKISEFPVPPFASSQN